MFMRALEWFTGMFTRKPKPRYCDLFIQVVALLIFVRKQENVSDEGKAMIRTLIGAAQRIMTVDEWLEVQIQAQQLLKEHPPIVGAWLDSRDALNSRLGVDNAD